QNVTFNRYSPFLLNIWYVFSNLSVILSPLQPVSSSTSRIAVSSIVSFFSMPPFGRSHFPFLKMNNTCSLPFVIKPPPALLTVIFFLYCFIIYFLFYFYIF